MTISRKSVEPIYGLRYKSADGGTGDLKTGDNDRYFIPIQFVMPLMLKITISNDDRLPSGGPFACLPKHICMLQKHVCINTIVLPKSSADNKGILITAQF